MLSYLALLSRSAIMWIVAQTADKSSSGLWAARAAKEAADLPQGQPRGHYVALADMPSSQQMSAVGGNMGFSTTDWVALFILGACALGCTFRKRLVRIIGLAVMPFAFAGLLISLSHHERAPGQGPITNSAPSGVTANNTNDPGKANNANNTNNQSGGTDILNMIGPQRLLFDATIGDQLASKLPAGKSIEILAVGSRTDWSIADQYAQYLKAKGFAVSFTRSSETVPPLNRKITLHNDPTTSPIIVIIAPSAL